jgi:AcrR family transcriptional regulator
MREQLIEAAGAEFTEFGFHGTDTNRIARRGGLGPASFYRHFADKDAVFREVYARWIAQNWRRLGEIVGGPGAPEQQAKKMAKALVAHYREAGGVRASVHALQHQSEAFRQMYLAEGRRQLEVAATRRRARGLPPLADEEHLAIFYVVERLADAIAFGEVEGLDLKEAALMKPLERVLTAYLSGEPLAGESRGSGR